MEDAELAAVEVSPKDAADALAASERTIYFWLERGEIEGAYQTITGKWRIPLGGLAAFLMKKAAEQKRGGERAKARFDEWVKREGGKFVA